MPPRNVFSWNLGPFFWSPYDYDHISGYQRVFWRFWSRVEPQPIAPPPVVDCVGLDQDVDF